jgi:PAS domain S-box-containing protein
MESSLRILHLEDDVLDAELVHATLASGGLAYESVRVETREDFEAELEQGGFDLIFSDRTLPAFDGISALALAREKYPDLPFIFVSGTLGEEAAIESLQNGATDYVLKQRLKRLVPVTRRALLEAEERRELRCTEEKLRQIEARFRPAFDHAGIGMALLSVDGFYIQVNHSLCEILGYSEEELLTRTFQDITHPDDLDADLMHMHKLVAGEVKFYHMEKRYFHKDGHIVWAALTGTLVRDPNDRPLYFVGQVQDISQGKQGKDALAASEAELRALFAAMSDVIVVLDAEGRYLQIAPTNPSSLYKPNDDLLGRTIYEVWPAADADYILHKIQLALEKQNPIYVEYSLLFDGISVWFDGTLSPMGEGKVFWIARDITERKITEGKLEALAIQMQRSNRELEEFAAVASHDLQEPLRKIQAFGDRLAVKCAGSLDDDGRDYLTRMLSSATRMSILIDDLLDYSRLTIKPRRYVKVNLAVVCQEVLSDLGEQIERVGGRVEVGDLPTIEADAMQMRRLFQNLITNGLKFAREGVPPVIRVEARRLKPSTGPFLKDRGAMKLWEIIVRDEGIGFDEKYVDRIFAPFQRLHGRSEYEGTGIGLAICRKIAESHWGSITAQSAAGQGAAFIVTLPTTQPAALPTALPQQRLMPQEAGGL